MLNNFIYAKLKSLFEEALNNGEVLDEAIVFIEDTKEIWNHGTYFDGSKVDLSNIETSILNILNTKLDNISDLETIRSGAALGATALQKEQYKGTVTSVKINGTTKTPDTNGMVDLGTIESGSSSSSGGAYAEVNHGTSDTTFTLTPNTLHIWDEVTSLDLSFADETAGVANEYLFQFTSGATATMLTLPDVKWVNDVTPEIISDKLYLISILNNMASIMEFNNSIFPYTLYFYEDKETPAERNPNSLLLYTKLLEIINSGLNPSTLVIVVSSGPYFKGYTPFTISTITNKPGIIIADVGARMYLYILQEDGSITYYDYD